MYWKQIVMGYNIRMIMSNNYYIISFKKCVKGALCNKDRALDTRNSL